MIIPDGAKRFLVDIARAFFCAAAATAGEQAVYAYQHAQKRRKKKAKKENCGS